jgi:hypothetical protein
LKYRQLASRPGRGRESPSVGELVGYSRAVRATAPRTASHLKR